MKAKECSHITESRSSAFEGKKVCEECEKIGGKWLHLRLCLTCGQTLCCDSSPNQHASKHAASHQHSVIKSAEEGESWLYCFSDKLFVNS